MNPKRIFQFIYLSITLLASVGLVCAEDTVVSGTITTTKAIDSQEGIVFNGAVLEAGAAVNTLSTYEVRLKPGTRIAAGARLTVNMRDNDGLSNRCEMYYFNHLNYGPGDDPDVDILTNLQECTLGTDPKYTDKDNDDDGLEDWWEIKYFGLKDLAQLKANGRDDDYDGDGISNGVEYKLGLDPSVENGRRPGLTYQYDDLGRITHIERIPAR